MMDEKKKVDTRPGNSTGSGKRSILQRLGGCLLCVCLVVVSTPVEYCIWPAMSAQAEDEETLEYTIVEALEPGQPAADGGLVTPEEGLVDSNTENAGDSTEGSGPDAGNADQTDPEDGDSQGDAADNQGETPEEEGEGSGTDDESDKTDEADDPETDPSDTDGEGDPKDPSDEGEADVTDPEEGDTDPEDGEQADDPEQDPSQEESKNPPETSDESGEDGEADPEGNGQDVPSNDGEEGDTDGQTPAADGEGDSLNEVEELLFQISNAVNAVQAATNSSTTSNFYSGETGNLVTNPEDNKFPSLVKIDGWEAVGWVNDGHTTNPGEAFEVGTEISVNGNYYGLYKKEIKVTYYINGQAVTRIGTSYITINGIGSNNRYNDVYYEKGDFDNVDLTRPGETLVGWSTSKDGEIDYKSNDPKTETNITLYPVYGKNVTLNFWSGNNSNATQDTWIQGEIKLPTLEAKDGWVAVGWCTNPDGSGEIINADTVISVTGEGTYYGVYEEKKVTLTFADKEGMEVPEAQFQNRRAVVGTTEVKYIEPEFDLSKRPSRPGYSCTGWYTTDEYGNEILYNGNQATFNKDTTLYAKWVDNIPPMFGEATFDEGYYSIFDWFVGQKGMTITVEVTEEGSGMSNAQYFLYPYEDNETGVDIDLSQGEPVTVRVLRQGGKTYVQFTINQDYKGKIALVGRDQAGNSSEKKILEIKNGVIIEDHAPEINFSADSTTIFNDNATVNVNVEDALQDMVSGGLKSIRYQIDNGNWVELPVETFNSAMLERHQFQVVVTGEGTHTLRIQAVDNAGNESEKQIRITIQKTPEENPGTEDGDNSGSGNNGSGNTGTGDDGNTGDGNTGNGDTGNNGGGNTGDTGNNGGGNTGDTGNNGSGNTGSGNHGNIFDFLFRPGNNGSIGGGTGNTGSSWGGSTGSTGNTGNAGLGSIGSNIVKNTGSGVDARPQTGEPQTGGFTHLEIYATLGMIAGFSYLLLYFQNSERGLTEEKKDALISKLSRWAARGGAVRKAVACIALFLLLAYYHSIGQCKEWADSLKEMTRA